MKKYILLFMLSWITLPAHSMFCQKIQFTSLDVNSDGSWYATVSFSVFEDTLLIISGADTARFTFTEKQLNDIQKYFEFSNEFRVYGDLSSTELNCYNGFYDFTVSSSDVLHLEQSCDSLEVTIFNDSMLSFLNNDKVYYGDDYFLPSFADDRYMDLNLMIYDCYKPLIGTAQLVTGGRSISPYVLRGKVYDSRGLLVRNQSFWHTIFGCNDLCYADFKTGTDGSYIFDIYTDKKKLNSLTTVFNNQEYPIQPITLGKPFGDTINVDIHLLGPLAEGEDAPDAISVQRSGNTLHVSGAVREIALIDASGRSLSCTRSADVDIELLPAGVYYLSVQMADGSLFRHPFSK